MKKGIFILSMIITFVLMSQVIFAETDGYNLFGDADNNDIVNADDALRILKITAKIEEMGSGFSIRKNDYDYNYQIDAEDALGILKISAKLEDGRIIEDPENFFDECEYLDGYPEEDFISCDLTKNINYSIEEGRIVKDTWRISFDDYRQGIKQTTNRLVGFYDKPDFDKIYWGLRWLIEDAKKTDLLDVADEELNNFLRNEVENNAEFNGYVYTIHFDADCMFYHSTPYIGVFITNENEMYLYIDNRIDFYRYDNAESSCVYKYNGEIPKYLSYEFINKFYDTLDIEESLDLVNNIRDRNSQEGN